MCAASPRPTPPRIQSEYYQAALPPPTPRAEHWRDWTAKLRAAKIRKHKWVLEILVRCYWDKRAAAVECDLSVRTIERRITDFQKAGIPRPETLTRQQLERQNCRNCSKEDFITAISSCVPTVNRTSTGVVEKTPSQQRAEQFDFAVIFPQVLLTRLGLQLTEGQARKLFGIAYRLRADTTNLNLGPWLIDRLAPYRTRIHSSVFGYAVRIIRNNWRNPREKQYQRPTAPPCRPRQHAPPIARDRTPTANYTQPDLGALEREFPEAAGWTKAPPTARGT
jgi:hypothetical protein